MFFDRLFCDSANTPHPNPLPYTTTACRRTPLPPRGEGMPERESWVEAMASKEVKRSVVFRGREGPKNMLSAKRSQFFDGEL